MSLSVPLAWETTRHVESSHHRANLGSPKLRSFSNVPLCAPSDTENIWIQVLFLSQTNRVSRPSDVTPSAQMGSPIPGSFPITLQTTSLLVLYAWTPCLSLSVVMRYSFSLYVVQCISHTWFCCSCRICNGSISSVGGNALQSKRWTIGSSLAKYNKDVDDIKHKRIDWCGTKLLKIKSSKFPMSRNSIICSSLQ